MSTGDRRRVPVDDGVGKSVVVEFLACGVPSGDDPLVNLPELPVPDDAVERYITELRALSVDQVSDSLLSRADVANLVGGAPGLANIGARQAGSLLSRARARS